MDSMSNTEAIEEWHEIAEQDLGSAKYLMNMQPIPREIIAYHCQQCAEKYLKSYLVYNDEDVVKTHDLVELIKLCAKFNDTFMEIEKQCAVLVRYVTDTRYPPLIDLTDCDIKKALDYAEEVKEFVLKVINE